MDQLSYFFFFPLLFSVYKEHTLKVILFPNLNMKWLYIYKNKI